MKMNCELEWMPHRDQAFCKTHQKFEINCIKAERDSALLLNGELEQRLLHLPDEILNHWIEGFRKHGFHLHRGLTPERNAKEWADKIQEKDRLNSELAEAKGNLLDFIGHVRVWAMGQPTGKSIQESCLRILEKYAIKRKCEKCGECPCMCAANAHHAMTGD